MRIKTPQMVYLLCYLFGYEPSVGRLLKIDLVINQGPGSDIEYPTCQFYLQVIPDPEPTRPGIRIFIRCHSTLLAGY